MRIEEGLDSASEAAALSVGTKTAKVASSIVFARLMSFLFSGVAFILVARILGTDVYGVYTIAVAFAAVFAAMDLGLHYGANKFIGEYFTGKSSEKINRLLSNVLAIQIISAVILTLIAFALSQLVSTYVLHSVAYIRVLQYVSILVFLQLIYGTFSQSLFGFGNGRHITAMLVTQAALQAVISVVLALDGFGAVSPIIGAAVGLAAATLLALALILRGGTRLRTPSFAGIKKILHFTLPIGASSIFTLVSSNLTPIVLGIFVLSGVVGNFGITSKTNTFIGVFTESVGFALLPMFASAMAKAKQRKNVSRIFNYSVYTSFILVTPLLFWLALLSRQFTLTVFGPTYTLAPFYISIMSLGVLISILGAYSTMLMISANLVRKVMKYSAVLFVMQLASLLLLTWAFNGAGAVTSLFIVAPLVTSILFFRGAYMHLGVRVEAWKLVRVVMAAAISIAFAIPLILLLQGHYIPILASVAIEQVLIYPIFLALLGGITNRDAATLNKLMSSVPGLGAAMSGLVQYAQRFIR
ncbi:MAG: oligosaccharide flippase family protein [Candidatus Micrarchaeota archaeon]|nr:oligosaccharide flippase family protein [Candidatus Micrarchaeota archaeon]